MRTPQSYPVFSLSEASSASTPSRPKLGFGDDEGAEDVEERAWISGIRAGHEAAFEALFRHYYVGLYDYMLTHVKAPDVARDCVQSVLLSLWERRTRIDIRESVRHYLYQAARTQALNWLKRNRSSVGVRVDERPAQDLSITGFTPPTPAMLEARTSSSALAQVVTATLDRLPTRRREALVLRVQHQLSTAGVAKVMGLSARMVEIHVTYALKALRESLDHRLGIN